MGIRWIVPVLFMSLAGFFSQAQQEKEPVINRTEPALIRSFLENQQKSRIDDLVFGKLERLGIAPADFCTDAVFVRRAYLDVIGTLPTTQEARRFLLDRNLNKRAVLIDELLERDEFADYWAMKWSNLLRIKAEFPINLWPNAVQAYHRWIRTSIHENKPYDRFVREMLTANGSNFRDPPVNFYRAVQGNEPQTIAQAVALTFMGSRAENWETGRLEKMSVFFSQLSYKSTGEWKEEIVAFDPGKAITPSSEDETILAFFPDGTRTRLSPGLDPRNIFSDWLIDPENPWFTKNIANRIWYWLLGHGIIHEPDDIRPDNPPVNPHLLAYLEQELIKAQYDLKHLFRLILNSRTYQLSCIPKTDSPQARANFAYYPLRRLEAEVLIDALNQITGTTEKYSSAIPEPFTFIPENQRSIALADGSITSPFLELFGRPSRDTGLESERNNSPTASQRLHMLNSSHIQRKIEQSARLRKLMESKTGIHEITNTLYLMILSRYPREEEQKIIQAYSQSGVVKGREAMIDLIWALINSTEFLYRH
ncbi:MAG: DUF1553 domain-containing protein [Sedimentisphaerales bacterium]|nr:DUF1553 domain-containing protein [Sedimentisphaerales bacterium]